MKFHIHIENNKWFIMEMIPRPSGVVSVDIESTEIHDSRIEFPDYRLIYVNP